METYVEILRAADEARDTTEASRLALEILERRGLSDEQLEAFVGFHREDPQFLADVWREIETKLRAAQDSAREAARTPAPADSMKEPARVIEGPCC